MKNNMEKVLVFLSPAMQTFHQMKKDFTLPEASDAGIPPIEKDLSLPGPSDPTILEPIHVKKDILKHDPVARLDLRMPSGIPLFSCLPARHHILLRVGKDGQP